MDCSNNTFGEIEIISNVNFLEIVDFRKREFKRAYGETTDCNFLNWDELDAVSIHIGKRLNKDLISYMRLSGFKSKSVLDIVTGIPLSSELKSPCALISRAATKYGFEQKGHLSSLRILAFEICLANQIYFLLGSLESKQKRLLHLEKLGYQVIESRAQWEGSTLSNSEPAILMGIQSKKVIRAALSTLTQRQSVNNIYSCLPKLFLVD